MKDSKKEYWKVQWREEGRFRGNGNKYKDQARIAELERLLGQAHAENKKIKKPLP